MRVRRLKFGYELTDIDYRSKDHAEFIKEKIGFNRFVVVKNKKPVHPDTLAVLYRKIGMLGVQPEGVKSALEINRAFCRVRSGGMFSGDRNDGELSWHNALQGRYDGDQLICMYMVKNNCVGGDTGFTDGTAAFYDLPREQQEFWMTRQAEYPVYDLNNITKEIMEKSYFKDVYSTVEEAKLFLDGDGGRPHDRQRRYIDVVTKHPLTGKKGFFFPYETIKGFRGYRYERASQMRSELIKHILQDKYVYWHKWEENDLIFTDQVHSLHKRKRYKGERELWRSGIMYR